MPPLGIEGEDDDDDDQGGAGGRSGGVGSGVGVGVGVGGMKFGLGRLWRGWGREREVVAVR